MSRSSTSVASVADTTAINLSQLLSRLEKIVLTEGTPENAQLQKSRLERGRVTANLEYARTLLLKLEHQNSSPKHQSRKPSMQAQLLEHRDLIKRLQQRLHALDQLDDDDVEDDEEEDLLGEEETQESPLANRHLAGPSPDSQSPLDRRRDSLESSTDLTSTPRRDNSTTTSSQLFASSSAQAPSSTSTDTLLTHNRHEQETLTNSLLSMAQALRASSQAFSSSLESEKNVLDRAVEGLDKNSSGMEAAEKRMGTLRKMSEGKGWWGRILIYGYIAGLMVLALVIVGVLPKLRF